MQKEELFGVQSQHERISAGLLLPFPRCVIYNPNKLEIAISNTSLNFAE
jgi:hypothetical protein